MNIIEGKLSLNGGEKVAIVVSRFNSIFTDELVKGAKDAFVRSGGDEAKLSVVFVPGAFEIPLVVQKLCESKYFDGVCTLGAVIRGSTPHFDYVSAEATKGIASVSLKSGVPVAFGVLTTNNIEQTIERSGSKAGNKGFEAMSGLIEMINLLQRLPNGN